MASRAASCLLRCAGLLWLGSTAGCDGDSKKGSIAQSDDIDGDGYTEADGDCDEDDAEVNPDATEVCDGIDNDCNGAVDEGVTEIWYPDADGDGFGADDAPTEACSRPDNHVPSATDCDDFSAEVFPGAAEVCDGVDTDCDDIPDPTSCRQVETAELRIDGTIEAMRLGGSVSAVGDWDGDGVADLAVGAPEHDAARGGVWIFRGPMTADDWTPADAAAFRLGADNGQAYAHAVVALPDLDGDGLPELAVGAWGDTTGGSAAGAVEILRGGTLGEISDADVIARYEGSAPGEIAGNALAFAGDLNGDGTPDLVIGAPGDDTAGLGAGAAYIITTRTDGSTTSTSAAFARILGPDDGTSMGQAVEGPGDLDGDGLPDLLLAATGDDTGGEDAGAFFILHGPITADRATIDADSGWFGEATGDQAGGSIAAPGDVNDDGYADLVVGAPDQDLGGNGAGLIYIIYGPSTGAHTLDRADARLVGRQPGDHAGNALDASADVDGDGIHDVLIGAYIDDSAAINAGAAYLVLGPWSGTTYLTEAEGGFIGEAEADVAGWSVAIAGDLNDGGQQDIVVGAPGHDKLATDGGVAYVIFGEGLSF